jgi:opacity protein-like surface antigen
MKIIKFTFPLLVLFFALKANAQKSPENLDGSGASKFSTSIGFGTANYYGDLIKNSSPFKQSSFSFSAGLSYAFTKKIAAKLTIGAQRVQGNDSKSGGAHPSRNLNFKSNVFDLSVSGEYTILDLDRFPLSPYISAGVGVMAFSPYTTDVNGRKQSLSGLGTEGQGLAGYKKPYGTATVELPVGIGVKYPVNEKLMLMLDFNYRFTGTDYLDDVSSDRYPDKAALDAKNPAIAQFTWRGAGSYPAKNSTLPRGNPENKDGFFTTQLKIAIKF